MCSSLGSWLDTYKGLPVLFIAIEFWMERWEGMGGYKWMCTCKKTNDTPT